ncbi:hypothetical protein QBC33DRAFT_553100 [Phialemonium atrogriseum]|uniref:Secreted protein n=1 Tax=Phialemonium atrogriseum TaxID=1093897 RepID=A0AAJ0BPA7_9PEZI|nr:uncharacterized protein QBC33DRAFT_553100 [Phialemonium atrogriseum]KAK1761978.1 hypothetical protein QBC33DRAFT_553100 [Phialemonium atrogriseum]
MVLVCAFAAACTSTDLVVADMSRVVGQTGNARGAGDGSLPSLTGLHFLWLRLCQRRGHDSLKPHARSIKITF